MLKPTSVFLYVFQDASASEESACVALTVGLEDGDCGFPVSELQDTTTIERMRNMISFFILDIL